MDLLASEFLDLKGLDIDLSFTAFDSNELDALLLKPNAADDEVPPVPEVPTSLLGDLWVMGGHRLLCGDATKAEDVARVMQDAAGVVVFADPPYGINSVKGGKVGPGGRLGFVHGPARNAIVKPNQYAPVIGDDGTATAQAFYEGAIAWGFKDFILWGGNYFTGFLPPSRCWLIWDKQNAGNFADVEIAWSSFNRPAKLYSFMWNGLAREGERSAELKGRVHPNQKPVGLFRRIFVDFPFSTCLDPFLGSGSTLVACELSDRKCYGLELSPAYCDVIVTRWQNLTGKQAVLGDGDYKGATFEHAREGRLREWEDAIGKEAFAAQEATA
jgi:hypothetical protein